MFLVLTLSNGYKKPETGDKGATVFNALEDNIDRVNGHSHDGTDSNKLDTFAFGRGSVTVPNTGWTAEGNIYRQSVTFPTGYSVANGAEWGKASIRFYFDGGNYDKEELFPKTERIDDTSFYLYSTVNNQGFTCTFV